MSTLFFCLLSPAVAAAPFDADAATGNGSVSIVAWWGGWTGNGSSVRTDDESTLTRDESELVAFACSCASWSRCAADNVLLMMTIRSRMRGGVTGTACERWCENRDERTGGRRDRDDGTGRGTRRGLLLEALGRRQPRQSRDS